METVAWIAFVFCLVGSILAAHKIKWCWLVFFGANIAWMIYAIQNHSYALFCTEIVFIVSNIYGLIKWK